MSIIYSYKTQTASITSELQHCQRTKHKQSIALSSCGYNRRVTVLHGAQNVADHWRDGTNVNIRSRVQCDGSNCEVRYPCPSIRMRARFRTFTCNVSIKIVIEKITELFTGRSA